MADRNVELAYKLLNTPIDPNLRCPLELSEIANYVEGEMGETIHYFASPAQDRGVDVIYAANADGDLTAVKVPLKGVSALAYEGLQSNLDYVLITELLNSKDQGALAARKNGIIRAMDNEEVRRMLNLCFVASQEVTKDTGEDILDVIIKMKQKVSPYATDYILLVASDVMDSIERYDKENVTSFMYKMSILEEIEKLGIKKVVKILGNSGLAGGNTPVLAAGKAILVGRDSSLTSSKPLSLVRAKFTGEVATNSSAAEGSVRLISVADAPTVINSNGKNTIGYGVYGFEGLIEVNLNYRAISWSDEIIA